ncbi:MAG: sigma-54-dependent Fis family transcriptional regulator [Gemmatimonadaceae bacterium]|nr:sigma-54-dependent Fis family transcriptional regulator [Gemmatimonadaceae bacterium]
MSDVARFTTDGLPPLALHRGSGEPAEFRGLFGNTSIMREVFQRIDRVGRTDVTVLLTGESGTGKELAARALHDVSTRHARPFVALNCSALPADLVESELFGHTRGAFTGAVRDHGGLFEAAHGGTLFLDEIGDLGAPAQAKVLRALENGEVMRVGGTRTTHVNVRLIAATNRPLEAMVEMGHFREDLLYRLKVIAITLPPLRERRADIALLVHHFLQVYGARHTAMVQAISPEALTLLEHYAWPGNVRELRNAIEGAVVMCDGDRIEVRHLPPTIVSAGAIELEADEQAARSLVAATQHLPFAAAREQALQAFDRAFLAAALDRHGGNIARTARALGLHRQSLQKLLARRSMRAKRDQLAPPTEPTDS